MAMKQKPGRSSKASVIKDNTADSKKRNKQQVADTNGFKNEKETEQREKGLFEKNGKGGPGRPQGSKSWKAPFFASMGEGTATKAMDQLRAMVEEGDREAVLFVVSNLHPKSKSQTYTNFDLGPVKTMGDLNTAMEKVINGISTEELTHEEAVSLIDVLEKKRKFIFENRLQVMLDAMRKNGENLNVEKIMAFFE